MTGINFRSENARYLGAVFLSNTCAAMAFAILSPALVANLTETHTSTFLIAVTTSIWALPNVIGGPFYTRLIARFNPRTCLLIGVFCAVSTLLFFPIFRNVWAWIALQLVGGAVLGHFFLVTTAREASLRFGMIQPEGGRQIAYYLQAMSVGV